MVSRLYVNSLDWQLSLVYRTFHTYALKCVVPRCIAPYIDSSGAVDIVGHGNRLIVMKNLAPTATKSDPVSSREWKPDRDARVSRASLQAGPW